MAPVVSRSCVGHALFVSNMGGNPVPLEKRGARVRQKNLMSLDMTREKLHM